MSAGSCCCGFSCFGDIGIGFGFSVYMCICFCNVYVGTRQRYMFNCFLKSYFCRQFNCLLTVQDGGRIAGATGPGDSVESGE